MRAGHTQATPQPLAQGWCLASARTQPVAVNLLLEPPTPLPAPPQDGGFRERTSRPRAHLVSSKGLGCEACVYYHLVIVHSNTSAYPLLGGGASLQLLVPKTQLWRLLSCPRERFDYERHSQQRSQGD